MYTTSLTHHCIKLTSLRWCVHVNKETNKCIAIRWKRLHHVCTEAGGISSVKSIAIVSELYSRGPIGNISAALVQVVASHRTDAKSFPKPMMTWHNLYKYASGLSTVSTKISPVYPITSIDFNIYLHSWSQHGWNTVLGIFSWTFFTPKVGDLKLHIFQLTGVHYVP